MDWFECSLAIGRAETRVRGDLAVHQLQETTQLLVGLLGWSVSGMRPGQWCPATVTATREVAR